MYHSTVHISILDCTAREVLDHYAAPLQIGLSIRRQAGGFSDADLFRIDNSAGSYCLRAWPVGTIGPERLNSLHRLMATARREGLLFVPRLFATGTGATWVQHGGRFWEMQEWMPGRADFCERRSAARLENACRALAQLHLR